MRILNKVTKFGLSFFSFFSQFALATVVDLRAYEASTSAWRDAWDSNAWYCDIPTSGLAPNYPPNEQIRVGYKFKYDPGTEPLPCASKRYYNYQGLLRFPVYQIPYSPLIRIKNAKLYVWWEDSYNTPHYIDGRRVSEPISCAGVLHEGPGRWPAREVPTPFNRYVLPEIASLPPLINMSTPPARFVGGNWLEIDVTATVAKWYRQGGNTGFLLANRMSSYTGSTAHHFECNTRYSNPILRVDYRRIDIAPAPRPPFPG